MICIIMRGLVACGKSTTAKKLVGEGLICETDEYFNVMVGDDPEKYNYDGRLREIARTWNMDRFKKAVDEGVSPVIVDRSHSTAKSPKPYVSYAIEHGYEIQIREPDSHQWEQIKPLLLDKVKNRKSLYDWSIKLQEISGPIHNVAAWKIFDKMMKWESDITVSDILK